MVGCSSSLDSVMQERGVDIYLNIKPSWISHPPTEVFKTFQM